MNDDGTMSRVPQLMEFSKKHNMKIVTVKDLIKYRMRAELFVKRITTTTLPTEFGGILRLSLMQMNWTATYI